MLSRKRFDQPRGVPIGADAEWILSLDIEEIRGLVEHGGDFGVVAPASPCSRSGWPWVAARANYFSHAAAAIS